MLGNFDKCYFHVMKWEGGYVDHPKDPGGATNYGITHKTLEAWRGKPVSKQDVKNLTHDEAKRIYGQRYWAPVRGNELPPGMDLVAFDAGVNSGPRRGIQWLQKGLRVAADGKIGKNTLGAAHERQLDGVAVIQRACNARRGFLIGLNTWKTFGKGWGRRVASTEAEAVAMWTKNPHTVREEARKAKKAGTNSAAMGGASGSSIPAMSFSDIMAQGWFWPAIGVAALIMLFLILKAVKERQRAAAYTETAQGMADG